MEISTANKFILKKESRYQIFFFSFQTLPTGSMLCCKAYSVQFLMDSDQYTVYSYSAQCTVWIGQCTVYSLQLRVYSVHSSDTAVIRCFLPPNLMRGAGAEAAGIEREIKIDFRIQWKVNSWREVIGRRGPRILVSSTSSISYTSL